MKISIVGAGAMGSLFGGLLAESGNEVTLIDVNDAHIGAVRTQGLRLATDGGERQVTALKALRPEDAVGFPDLLLVFTKTLHTSAALSGVGHLIGPDVHVLSLQNGLGNVEKIAGFVPPERVLIGVTTWPADMVGPGHVQSHGKGVVRLMAADGIERPFVSQVAEVLTKAGLDCTSDRTVWAAIWEKVAFNAALNSICAVSGCTVDELGKVPDGSRLANDVVTEVLSVAMRMGIDVDPAKCWGNVANAIARHRGHKPSMLQDVLAGRRTEVESINGAVVALAGPLNIKLPVTETLLSLVRLAETRANA
ncbi:2-dehydropantoate 2-reductase [Variovorax boronicumulans]|uniref:ketopantoate reductase family protein n=1 Tax=Variovorax boronicumulans TaxID=436515 RepID=UPI002784BA8B|nr:2-dehydropantoate 2-reductase [Variovorax boronicumulans]MDQ0083143.1 2-dehydropantoate 2-reductase [Variovorax boronicumulans]